MNNKALQQTGSVDAPLEELCRNAIDLVTYARGMANKQINTIQLMTFYAIGKWIVEVQQNGDSRAKYGKQVLKKLSSIMTEKFGRGFSVDNLENMRRFYLTYKDRISETTFRIFAMEKSETASRVLEEEKPFSLSFSHYLILCRIQNDEERSFYEVEARNNGWNVKTLQRQYGSSLYERVLLSQNKNKVMKLAEKGKLGDKAENTIKDPYVLEFLGLKEDSSYSESDLETRIIDHLQEFLMEMGKGFLFVGRQVRFTFEEDHYL